MHYEIKLVIAAMSERDEMKYVFYANVIVCSTSGVSRVASIDAFNP